MDFATVNFICDHMVVTVQVGQPDIDDEQYIINVANEIINNAYGFFPKDFSNQIEVDY
jgi:ABC-type proline/glycine betaine transport system substrate-binding protein